MRFLISIAFVVFASSAQATTVLSVSGDDIDGEIMSTAGIAPNEGVGVSFDVTSDLINAAFALEFECFTDAGCSGLVQWSNTGLGPDSLNQDAALFSTAFGKSIITAFSGIDLAAATWAVLVTLEDSIAQTAAWTGSRVDPTITGDGRASVGATQIINDFDPNNPIRSTFTTTSNSVDFTLTADEATAVVPLPMTAIPMITGLMALGFFGRRRKRHA